MRSIEKSAINSGKVSELELMERAGKGVSDLVIECGTGSNPRSQHAILLCGPGNNGGDGYVAARLLRQSGWKVAVWSLGAAQPESTSAGIMRARWLNHGKIRNLESLTHEACDANAVVVDALFGTGLSRPIDKTATRALEIGTRNGRLITVDILSGVNADTGEFLADGNTGIRSSNCTVTFECPKIGHYLGSGGMLSGEIRVVPLGLDSELDQLDALDRTPRLFRFPESRYFESLAKHPNRHKYQHGHLVVVSGGPGRGGAARLAARAALRIGTGLVTVAAHTDAIAEHAAQLNAIMLADVSSSDSLRLLLSDERINAVCIGPGLGTGPYAKKMVFAALSCNQNVILDADALTAFVGDPNELFALANGRSVLTPHIGEFRRLFPDLASEMSSGSNFSKIDAARAAADRSGCVILLKGADTVVAKPGHAARLVASTGRFSAPWLATAGSGDVLSGMISGLVARGAEPMDAAVFGAWIHSEAARKAGPGLIAEDIPDGLPALFAQFEQNAAYLP